MPPENAAHLYLEYGGGLGDILMQMFERKSYAALDSLRPEDSATVVLVCHNPHARELFEYHPKSSQIVLRDLGYWTPDCEQERRAHFSLPRPRPEPPFGSQEISFYPAPSDQKLLRRLKENPYIIFAVSAGETDRTFPGHWTEHLIRQTLRAGFLPVFVGRTYQRHGRSEYHPVSDGALDAIDRLTVPGVAEAVRQAAGVICCHSSINILAWLLRIPQLLLYPKSAYDRHMRQPDQWAFGINFPECWHGLFDDPASLSVADQFFKAIRKQYPQLPMKDSPGARLRTVPYPEKSRAFVIDESIPRLTPPHDVKVLCSLAQEGDGNIAELGCNQGLTTRELALCNPDKIVYAFDYFGSDMQISAPQMGECPDPRDFGRFTRGLSNVVCAHHRLDLINYEAFKDISTIFIDGNHSYWGVKADTECALAYLARRGRGTLIWHDYYANAPDWVGVKRYVDSLDMEVECIEGTWLAVARITGH